MMKSTPSWIKGALSNITTLSCILLTLYLLFDYTWKRRYQQRHRRSSSQTTTINPKFFPPEEKHDLTGPGDLIRGIHVFSFLEREVSELLANSAVIESFSGELDLDTVLDSSDLVIVESGRVNAYYNDVLIGCIERGGLVSSLLDLLCLLTGTTVEDNSAIVTFKVIEEGSVIRIPKETMTELKQRFPLNAAHLMQLIVSRFVRATLGVLKDYTKVDDVIAGALELEDPKRLVEMQDVIKEGEASFLVEAKSAELSGAALKYLLAILNVQHIPTNSTLLDRLIQDNELLQVEYFKKDSTILHPKQVIPGVMLLIRGSVRVRQRTFKPGALLHLMSMFVTQRAEVEVVSGEDSIIAWLPSEHCDLLIDRVPSILDAIIRVALLPTITPLQWAVDLVVDLRQALAGQVLTNNDEQVTSILVILHGRLRIHSDPSNKRDFAAGSTIGMIEYLSKSTARKTVAVRDSELVVIPGCLVDALLSSFFPERGLEMARSIARQVQEPAEVASNTRGYKTVAIVPTNQQANTFPVLPHFATLLRDAIHAQGSSCCLLDSRTVLQVLGRQAFAAIGKLKLSQWLAEQEELHQVVLYLADPIKSLWTFRCIRQADLMLFVAIPDAESGTSLGVLEKWVSTGPGGTGAGRELVVLHSSRHRPPFTETMASWTMRSSLYTRLHHVLVPNLDRLLRNQRVSRKLYEDGRSVDDSVLQSVGFVPSTVLEETLYDWIDGLKHSFVDLGTFGGQRRGDPPLSSICWILLV